MFSQGALTAQEGFIQEDDNVPVREVNKPSGFIDEPADQEAPLLGKEEIPFWHDTRISTGGFYLVNDMAYKFGLTEAHSVMPGGYGMFLGWEAVPTGAWYPELHAELSFLNFDTEANSVFGGGAVAGFAWVIPLGESVTTMPGSIQVAVLPGASYLRIQDRIETVTAFKFLFQGALGYELPIQKQMAVFVQARYSYIYDPKVPFHCAGVYIGASYHLKAALRKGS